MRKKNYPVIELYETGQNIKNRILLEGLTVKDVQDYLELGTPQSIYHWFDGRNLPTLDNLYALSELLRVPMDLLVKGNRKHDLVPCKDATFQRIFIYYEKILLSKQAS